MYLIFKLTKIGTVLGVQVKLFETYYLYVEDNFAQHNNEMRYFCVFNYKSYQRCRTSKLRQSP